MGQGFAGAYFSGFQVFDYHTETQGTAIDEEIQAQNGKRLVLLTVDYLAGSTAQDMNVMFANGDGSRNTMSALAISGQKVANVTDTPLSPAGDAAVSGDIVAFQLTNGLWEFDTIDTVSTKAITMNNNIQGVDSGGGETAIAAGAKFLIFGIVADGSLFKVHLKASTLLQKDNTLLVWHPYKGEPFYVSNPNASNASFQNSLVFGFTDK